MRKVKGVRVQVGGDGGVLAGATRLLGSTDLRQREQVGAWPRLKLELELELELVPKVSYL